MSRSILMRNLIRFIVSPSEGGGGEDPAGAVEATGDVSEDTETGTDESTDDGDAPEAWDQGRALSKIRKANAEAKAQRERAKAAEAKASTLDDVTRERDDLALKVLRLETAAQFNIPPALASRLQGSTAEEMAEDAQALLEIFTPKAPPSQAPRSGLNPPAGRREVARVESSDDAWARMRSERR